MPEPGRQQRQALQAELGEVGAPPAVAATLADSATLEVQDGVLTLCLNGHCAAVEDEHDLAAGQHLAENMAADNAEAVDRTHRGEQGWTPWWPLPDRRDRR